MRPRFGLSAEGGEEFIPHLLPFRPHLWIDFYSHVTGSGHLAACRTSQCWLEDLFAMLVHQTGRRPFALRSHPPVAPMGHRDNNGVELQAFIGKPILVSSRPPLVWQCSNDTDFLEAFDPIREGTGRDAGVRLQLFEAANAEEEFSKQQQSPAFAYSSDGAGNGTG